MVDSLNFQATRFESFGDTPWTEPPLAVVFDFDDVLYDASLWSRWLVQILHRLGLHTHYQAFVHVLEHDYLIEAYRGRRPFWCAFRDFLGSLGLSSGQVDEVWCAAQTGRRRFNDSRRPFPGVKSTLHWLADGGTPLVLLANSAATGPQVEQKLQQLGLHDYFSAVLSSRQLGAVLPEADSYEAALDELALSPEQVAFVSHDRQDLAGAATVGMRTLAFNASGHVTADVHIDRFEQLMLLAEHHAARLVAG